MSSYVIIDLEMCMVPKGEKRKAFGGAQELIQIGAVLLNESYDIKETFMTFVAPEFGIIDSYISHLTGITDDDVKDAPLAKEALNSFTEWLPEDAVIVSWSDSDLKQIEREVRAKEIEIPFLNSLFSTWLDCQRMFSEKLGKDKKYKLSEAVNIANVDLDFGEHDALIDAKNTAYLFKKIMTEDELELSPYFSLE